MERPAEGEKPISLPGTRVVITTRFSHHLSACSLTFTGSHTGVQMEHTERQNQSLHEV